MTLSSDLPVELLDRYFTGRCSPEERARVKAALAHDPALRALSRIVDGEEVEIETVWTQFSRGPWMRDTAANPGDSQVLRAAAPRQSHWRKIAVPLAIVCAVVIGMIGVSRVGTPRQPSEAARQYVTAVGQYATLALTDSTKVILAPGSRLSVPDRFGSSSRTVSLVGEAYFEVTHSAHAPFVVRTGAIETTVLGTAFDIRARRGEHTVRVAVVTGKVIARGRTSVLTIPAGGVAEVADSSATMLADAPATQYTSWTNGRLVFANTPVAEVLATLSQWYGMEFRMTDSSLQQQHITGVFDARSRTNALTALQGVLDASMTFERAGGHLTVIINVLDHPVSQSRTTKYKHETFPPSLPGVGR